MAISTRKMPGEENEKEPKPMINKTTVKLANQVAKKIAHPTAYADQHGSETTKSKFDSAAKQKGIADTNRAKRGTSTGYMTGGATEKKKVPKEYRGNTNSEGGIPFGKKPQ
jgi:hypothetical protein